MLLRGLSAFLLMMEDRRLIHKCHPYDSVIDASQRRGRGATVATPAWLNSWPDGRPRPSPNTFWDHHEIA